MLLKGRVAFITGGAQGMGRAIALKFAEQGCSVALADLRLERARQTADEIVAAGAQAIALQADISRSAEVNAAVERAAERFGRIDVLVNAAGGVAGMEGNGSSDSITEGDWDRVINLNLKGSFLVTMAVLPHMKRQQQGKIIFISSMGAINPSVSVLHYHAAKAGVMGLALNLAFELAPRNIHVNTIVPGPIQTTFWDNLMPPGPERDAFFQAMAKKEVPMERMGTADDIAGPALFLASDLSNYMTGGVLNVGGGLPLLSRGGTFDIQGYFESLREAR
ncbi:MAG: SDR family oxidoreductase [Deltaproteobacteria bacterium]|nr:SDR family oxidoreductase [Deltaproteobacteria bacterium]